MALSGVSGSGLDVRSLVSQLMQVERAPAARYTSLRLAALARQTAWADLTSKLGALKTAGQAVDTTKELATVKAASSDDKVLTASAESGASLGSRVLTVNRLAAAQQSARSGLAGPDALAGAGTAFLSTGFRADGTAATGIARFSADATATPGTYEVGVVRASSAATKTGTSAVVVNNSSLIMSRTLSLQTEAGSASMTLANSYDSAQALLADVRAKMVDGTGRPVARFELDAGNRLRITSVAEGSAAQLDLSGSALGDLGLTSPTSVAGTAAAVLVQGTTLRELPLVRAGATLALGGGLSLTVDAGGGLRTGEHTTTLVRTTASDTVADLRDALNQPGGTVTGALLDTGGTTDPWSLVLSATRTGAAGAFAVHSDIAALGSLRTTQAGQDAEVVVDGLTVTRTSNTLTDVLPGVTLSLAKTGTTTVTVDRDQPALTAKAKALVDGLNAVLTAVSTQTRSGLGGAKAGPLVGSATARSVTQQLLGVSSQAAGAGTTRSLVQLGLTATRAGTYTLDEAALSKAATEDPAGTAALLSSYGALLASTAEQLLTSDGPVSAASKAAGTEIQQRQKQIDDLETRLVQVERRYTTTFSRLDAAMAVLSSQSSRLAAQIGGLPRYGS